MTTGNTDWFDEDFTAFLLTLKLPADRKGKTIKSTIKKEKESFVARYTDMLESNKHRKFSEGFYKSLADQLPKIRKVFNLLSRIIEFYDNADMAAAQEEFDTLMNLLESHLFLSDIYWPYAPSGFYRIRESSQKKLTEPVELFHIPYNSRQLITNERYSLAGHPCLYLSSLLHIGWQECGYPHRFYYSEFRYQKATSSEEEWKFITFITPRTFAIRFFIAINEPEEYYTKLAVNYMLSYPLLFACSLVNQSGKSVFKPEYVVPQMLTRWVYRNYDEIKGIKYFSCHENDEDVRFNGFNIVIPARDYDKRGIGKDLITRFKVSKPRLYENRLEDEAAEIVKKYKDDAQQVMAVLPHAAAECLYKLYQVADMLDKAIRNWEGIDMGLIITSIKTVSLYGTLLLANSRKDSIITECKNDPYSNAGLCENLGLFDSIFERFKTDVLDIADSYKAVFDQLSLPENTDFYFV